MLLCVLRPAVKLLLLSSFILWRPIITGSWWRGCTYIASSSWPSSLTRTTYGPSQSSAGVSGIWPDTLFSDTALTVNQLKISQFFSLLILGFPAVFVSIWVSARASLADTQWVMWCLHLSNIYMTPVSQTLTLTLLSLLPDVGTSVQEI